MSTNRQKVENERWWWRRNKLQRELEQADEDEEDEEKEEGDATSKSDRSLQWASVTKGRRKSEEDRIVNWKKT